MALAVTFHKAKAEGGPGAPLHLVRYHLHKAMHKVRPGRPLGKLHASDVTNQDRKFCGRERVLGIMTGIGRAPEDISTSLALTFSIGKHVQDEVVRHLCSTKGVGFADWSCLKCKKQFLMSNRPAQCDHCEGEIFEYEERRFTSPTTLISCGIDAMCKLGQTKFTPVEVKTIGPDDFAKLVAPLAEHQLRMMLYLKIISESDEGLAKQVDTTEGVILYASKGGYGKAAPDVGEWGLGDAKFSPFKEYRVKRNDEMVAPYEAAVLKYVEHRKAGTIPGGCCAHANDKRAYQCAVRGPCFSGKFPEGAKY